MFLLPTFKFNDQCPFSSNGDMVEDYQVSPNDWLGTMLCKCCFQEHQHQLLQEQDLSPVIHGDDTKHC